MMDLKAPIDGLIANWPLVLLGVAAVFASALLLRSGSGKRLAGGIERSFFANWQLTLLASTGIVLSVASGWTTWDGMRNFTGEPILSLMITFGIQGVMLIVAWLIGESFASGMSHQGKGAVGMAEKLGGSAAGVLLFLAAMLWLASGATSGSTNGNWFASTNAQRIMEYSAFAAVALLLVAVIWSFRNSDLATPYLQGTRVIVRNAVLWIMFLACMATSVFFSFDSLFSAIFPQDERKRAADLRAQNQVAGIVADIGATISTRRISEAEGLFAAQGWRDYEANLVRLSQQAQGAQGEIERYFVQQMEERRRGIAQQQERIATAQSGQAGLSVKKTSLTEELSRLTADRPGLASEYSQHKSELDAKAKEIDAKRVEAMAEERGVEGTGKVGKGQIWRQRTAELGKMQDEYKIKQERTKDAERRLAQVQGRIEQIRRELSAIDGDLAKLTGEAQTADQRIKVAEQSGANEEGPRVDPARVLPAFERARAEFRADPTDTRLAAVQQQCAQLLGAMTATPATKERVRGIDCDPKSAAEASQRVFALNAGWDTFNRTCAGGDKLPQTGGADALFSFARRCAQDAGLPSKDTDTLRTKINFVELNRDDKAHRFVVTWNAFNDANRLAYLALAIAVAIDSLVFMSGLFGANAVRSPLSDVPSVKPRSARQLEDIVENALLPDRFENATLVLESMHPITADRGFSAEVLIPYDEAPAKRAILKVLNAGATIGAVERDPDRPERYLVRAELFEFLSVVSRKAFDADKDNVRIAELRKIVVSSLQPHVGDHADIVLNHCHPISERQGFSAEMFTTRMSADDRFIVQKTLNAGATLGYVQLDDRADQQTLGRYYVHKQLYKTLLLIASAYPRTGLRSVAPALSGPTLGSPYGGALTAAAPAAVNGPAAQGRIAAPAADETPRQITRQVGGPPPLQKDPADKPASPTSQELKARFWNGLVGALGIDPQVALARLYTPGTEAQALDAWQMLDELAAHNGTLSHYLESYKKALENDRVEEYNRLRRELGGNTEHIDILDGVDLDVERVSSALMLFPEVGLLDHLIASIEAAAASPEGLQVGEQELRGRLVDIRDALLSADLASPQTWNWVGGQLADLSAKYNAKIERFAQPPKGGDQQRRMG